MRIRLSGHDQASSSSAVRSSRRRTRNAAGSGRWMAVLTFRRPAAAPELGAGRLGHSRSRGRALPHRPRPPAGTFPTRRPARSPGPRGPRRRDAAGPRRRIALRHPLDRRPGRPPRRSSGRAATSPGPAATSRNYAHGDRARGPRRVRRPRKQAQRGDGWVKLVGDWIDRDAGDLTACWRRAERSRRPSPRRTGWAPASPRTASPRPRCGIWWRRASTASSTPPGSPRRHPALRRARRRDRPHARQHRHVPGPRGGRRGQVPALVRPYALAVGAAGGAGARSPRGRGGHLCRHRRRQRDQRTAGSWTRSRPCTPPAFPPQPPSTRRAWSARTWLGADGHRAKGPAPTSWSRAEDPRQQPGHAPPAQAHRAARAAGGSVPVRS